MAAVLNSLIFELTQEAIICGVAARKSALCFAERREISDGDLQVLNAAHLSCL